MLKIIWNRLNLDVCFYADAMEFALELSGRADAAGPVLELYSSFTFLTFLIKLKL